MAKATTPTAAVVPPVYLVAEVNTNNEFAEGPDILIMPWTEELVATLRSYNAAADRLREQFGGLGGHEVDGLSFTWPYGLYLQDWQLRDKLVGPDSAGSDGFRWVTTLPKPYEELQAEEPQDLRGGTVHFKVWGRIPSTFHFSTYNKYSYDDFDSRHIDVTVLDTPPATETIDYAGYFAAKAEEAAPLTATVGDDVTGTETQAWR